MPCSILAARRVPPGQIDRNTISIDRRGTLGSHGSVFALFRWESVYLELGSVKSGGLPEPYEMADASCIAPFARGQLATKDTASLTPPPFGVYDTVTSYCVFHTSSDPARWRWRLP